MVKPLQMKNDGPVHSRINWTRSFGWSMPLRGAFIEKPTRVIKAGGKTMDAKGQAWDVLRSEPGEDLIIFRTRFDWVPSPWCVNRPNRTRRMPCVWGPFIP
jgi:hypothetical protein